jgi:hypothetical protein
MSEKIKITKETAETPERFQDARERIPGKHETHGRRQGHEHKENIDRILQKIEQVSLSSNELNKHGRGEDAVNTGSKPSLVGDQLKNTNLKQSLRRMRRNLKPYQRPFSKFLHNETIDRVSEISADTIARPNGLLFGGIAAFLTSLGVLWVCRYYGYEYNYFIGLVSFPAGFAIGLIGEFVIQPLRRK